MGRFKERYDRLKAEGLCTRCGKVPQSDTLLCVGCKAYGKSRYVAAKKRAFDHYGRTCRCCGYDFPKEFLTIDHVNNDGKEHRKQIGFLTLYEWVVRNDFPDLVLEL